MLIYPKRKYDVTVDERSEDSSIVLRFKDKPEDMVRMVLQVAGFVVKGDGTDFHTSNNELNAFGKEIAKCLDAGCFPTEVPYTPSHELSEKSFKKRRYGFVDVLYKDGNNDTQIRKVLVFETVKAVAEPLVWLDTYINFSNHVISAELDTSSNVGQAKLDFNNGNYLASISNPFGSGLDSNLNLKTSLDSDSLPDSELNSGSNSELNSKLNSEEKSKGIAEMDESLGNSRDGSTLTDSKPNSELNSESNSELNSEPNSELNSEPNSKEDSKLPVDREVRKNNRPELIAPIMQPYTYNYLKLHELIPNIVQEISEGKTYFKSKVDGYMDFNFDFLFIDTDGRYVFALSHLYEQNGDLVPDPDMEIRLDPILQTVEALSFQDYRSYSKVYEETEQGTAINTGVKKSLNTFLKTWLKNLVDQGHFIDLSSAQIQEDFDENEYLDLVKNVKLDEVQKVEEIDSENTGTEISTSSLENGNSLIPVSRIMLSTRNFDSDLIEENRNFLDWDEANKFFEEIVAAQGSRGSRVDYSVMWDNGVSYENIIHLGNVEIEYGTTRKTLPYRVLESLVEFIHIEEGRFKHLNEDDSTQINSELSQIIDSVDFGFDTLPVLESLLPKISVKEIHIDIGEAAILTKSNYKEEQKFYRAAEELERSKELIGYVDSIGIEILWEDGKRFTDELNPLDIGQPLLIDYWKHYLTERISADHIERYQWKDHQALLFSSEIEGFESAMVYSKLLFAKWQDSDPITWKTVYVNGVKYIADRLKEVVIQLVELSEASKRQEIVEQFASKFDKSNSLLPFVSIAVENEHELKAALRNLRFKLREVLNKLDDDLHGTSEHYKWLIEELLGHEQTLVDSPVTLRLELPPTTHKNELERLNLNKEIEVLIDNNDMDQQNYTKEEKELLKQYTGYGGLQTDQIKAGALSEYYTPNALVEKMWQLAYSYGYTGGDVLEPAVGIGNFINYAPKDTRVVAYERSYYSAAITKILYPFVSIVNKDFESIFFNGNIHLKNNFLITPFDLIIGNPPYGEFKSKYGGMAERKFTKAQEYDQYFISRGLDLLNSGGLLVFLISSYFISSKSAYNKIKKEIANKAILLKAYRLPNASVDYTEVGTDIVIFRKR